MVYVSENLVHSVTIRHVSTKTGFLTVRFYMAVVNIGSGKCDIAFDSYTLI